MPNGDCPALPDIECIRGFADASPMAVAVLQGAAQHIRYLNPAFLAATGEAGTALLGRPLAEAFPALAPGRCAALEQVRTTGTPWRAAAVPLPIGPGAPRLWDVELSALRGADPQAAGVLALLRDVSDLRAAESARAEEQARYRALIEAGSLAIWIAGPDGMLHEDARWTALTGQTPAQASGMGWLEAIHPEDRDRVRESWFAAVTTGALYEVEYRLCRPEGDWRWTAARAVPRRDAAGRIREWVGANADIDARKQAEARLHEALAAQRQWVRDTEHRIRNSLQLVAALLRLQSGRTGEGTAREALEAATARVQAVAEAHRALQLSPDQRSVLLSDMLRELAAGATVQHPGADLRIAAPDGLSLNAERAIPLALILAELLADALRHSRPDGAEHTVRLEARPEAGSLAVTVADGGLAEPDGSPAGRLSETVVRSLARQIGAELTTERTDGAGTRVTLRLGGIAGKESGPDR